MEADRQNRLVSGSVPISRPRATLVCQTQKASSLKTSVSAVGGGVFKKVKQLALFCVWCLVIEIHVPNRQRVSKLLYAVAAY